MDGGPCRRLVDLGEVNEGAVGMTIDMDGGLDPEGKPYSGGKPPTPGVVEEMEEGGPLNVAPAVEGDGDEDASSENDAFVLAMFKTKLSSSSRFRFAPFPRV
jgi:hypothetical protein